jgi:hypothetical protein
LAFCLFEACRKASGPSPVRLDTDLGRAFFLRGREQIMASLSSLRQQATAVAHNASDNPNLNKLARIVADLCRECENIESKASEAADDAEAALKEARG